MAKAIPQSERKSFIQEISNGIEELLEAKSDEELLESLTLRRKLLEETKQYGINIYNLIKLYLSVSQALDEIDSSRDEYQGILIKEVSDPNFESEEKMREYYIETIKYYGEERELYTNVSWNVNKLGFLRVGEFVLEVNKDRKVILARPNPENYDKQLWRCEGGQFKLKDSEMALDIRRGKMKPGTELIAYPSHGGPNQLWAVRHHGPLTEVGNCRTVSVANTNYAIDIEGQQLGQGKRAVINKISNAPSQYVFFELSGFFFEK